MIVDLINLHVEIIIAKQFKRVVHNYALIIFCVFEGSSTILITAGVHPSGRYVFCYIIYTDH